MNPAEAVFLYLPVPYWAAFVVLVYRHDLSRLNHPLKDSGSGRNWWHVLSYLGLLDAGTRRPSRRKEVLPCLTLVMISVGVSLSWALRILPILWYNLIIVQGISAMVLTVATVRYLGQPPRRPYVDVLRYPRLGSRVRHLPKMPATEVADCKKPSEQDPKTPKLTKVRRSFAAPFQRIKRRLKR